MREAFPPSLPITNNSSGIENNHKEHVNSNHHNHNSHTTSASANNHCLRGKDLNIDRNNEITRDISLHETEKICFDSDEGEWWCLSLFLAIILLAIHSDRSYSNAKVQKFRAAQTVCEKKKKNFFVVERVVEEEDDDDLKFKQVLRKKEREREKEKVSTREKFLEKK
jgi:hypothetical protein